MAKRTDSQHTTIIRADKRTPLFSGHMVEEVTAGDIGGGFSMIFNRVYDTGVFAHLSDRAGKLYSVLARLASHQNNPRELRQKFQFRANRKTIQEISGHTREPLRLAIQELVACALLRQVDDGKGTDPQQRPLYQLMLPIAGYRDKRPLLRKSTVDNLPKPRKGSAENPAHQSAGNPAHGPAVDSARRSPRDPAHGRFDFEDDSAQDFQQGTLVKKEQDSEDNSKDAAVALLASNGVDRGAAESLAAAHGYAACFDAVQVMLVRRQRGQCKNPGGLIREALIKGWAPPAEKSYEATAKRRAAETAARRIGDLDLRAVNDDMAQVERTIAALDDETLDDLAASVLDRYAGNTAVLAVLRKKPPRECRLMKMEIAAMLRPVS